MARRSAAAIKIVEPVEEPTTRKNISIDTKRKVIEEFIREHGRVPTADELIADARSPQHPLHSAFDFDDLESAAMYHWRDIARRIIGEVTISIKTSSRVIDSPVYVPDPRKEPKTQGFVQLKVAGKVKEDANAILQQAIDAVEAVYVRGLGIAAQLGAEKRYIAACKKLIID